MFPFVLDYDNSLKKRKIATMKISTCLNVHNL